MPTDRQRRQIAPPVVALVTPVTAADPLQEKLHVAPASDSLQEKLQPTVCPPPVALVAKLPEKPPKLPDPRPYPARPFLGV